MKTNCLLLGAFFCLLPTFVVGAFRVGRGIADITGQVSEGILYGYANPEQDARGLHLRQFSRAFAFEANGTHAVLVVAEITMISQAIHTEVFELLAAEFGDLYTRDNVMLTSTHTHAAPGGYHTYVMYGFPSGGFEMMTFRAAVDGIVKSIQRAHRDLQSGKVMMSSDDLIVASVNRSPFAYAKNPIDERRKYQFSVDTEMALIKLMDSEDLPLGMISLFPVHTTSMKNDNHLVSSDNKGYAAQMMERLLNRGTYPLKDSSGIIAAFAQTSEGDASPNTNFARCEEDDALCDEVTSTCPADRTDPNLCTGRGPTAAKKENEDDFKDTQTIGTAQFLHAMHLSGKEDGDPLEELVDSRFTWVNMSEVVVTVNGKEVNLCRPAMGHSFGAGASDGPGLAPFTQGMLRGNPIYDRLVNSLFPGSRTKEILECHLPKPVLLPTANMATPYPYWQPEIVPVQLLRIGQIVLIGIPGEITTMAGRRLQNVVTNVFAKEGINVTAYAMSMTNSYSSYIVTPEEYTAQRYEAASTIFGQYTLNGYMKVVETLAGAMVKGEKVDGGLAPPDLRYPEEAHGPTMIDDLPEGSEYGDVVMDVEDTYTVGQDASAMFIAGNPRNNLMTDRTFLEVQKYEKVSDDWVVVFKDAHWETKFHWVSECHNNLGMAKCEESQLSHAIVEWNIPDQQTAGLYRLVHYGYAKYPDGVIAPYKGTSKSFNVVKKTDETETGAKTVKLRNHPKTDKEKERDVADFFLQLIETKMRLQTM